MKQSDLAMVEALVAASLLGLGLLGASRIVQLSLEAARNARHLEQAQAIAHDTLDCAIAGWTPCPAAEPLSREGTVYTVRLEELPLGAHLREVVVTVRWSSGQRPEQLQWRSRRSTVPVWLGVSSADG